MKHVLLFIMRLFYKLLHAHVLLLRIKGEYKQLKESKLIFQ